MVGTLKVNQIESVNGNTNISIPTGERIVGTDAGSIAAPGTILQVKQAVISSTTSSTTGNTWQTLSGFDVTITPTASTSKFLLQLHAVVSNAYWQTSMRFLRASTAVGVGDADGNRPQSTVTYNSYDFGSTAGSPLTTGSAQYKIMPISAAFLDSPATTSSITYGVQWKGYSTSWTIYLNRSHSNNNASSYDDRPISSFTVMEVAG